MFLFLLILDIKYKIQLKHNKSTAKTDAQRRRIEKNVRALKKKLHIIRAFLVAHVIIVVSIVLVVSISIAIMMQQIASVTSANMLVINGQSSSSNTSSSDDWKWNIPTDIGTDVDDNGSGAYPKDHKLKMRAELLEIVNKCNSSIKSKMPSLYGNEYAEWVIGHAAAETRDSIVTWGDNDTGFDYYKNLCMIDPESYTDPWNKTIEQAEASASTGEILGPFQITASLYHSHVTCTFPDGIATSGGKQVKDTALGFYRPCEFYAPDAVLSADVGISGNSCLNAGDYTSKLKQGKYRDINAKVIELQYRMGIYGEGSAGLKNNGALMSEMNKVSEGLVEYSNSHPDERLDELIVNHGDVSLIYDSSKYSPKGYSWISVTKELSRILGFSISTELLGSNPMQSYGLIACNVGRTWYVKASEAVAKAEKEGGGSNYGDVSVNDEFIKLEAAGILGTGVFGKDGVYSRKCVWYKQYMPPFASHRLGSDTIGNAGCLVCSMAEVACTLSKDKAVNPNSLEEWAESRGMVGSDGGMSYNFKQEVSDKYSIKYKQLGYSIDDAVTAIKHGGFVIALVDSRYLNRGSGHYIVLRGYNEKTKTFMTSDPGNGFNSGEDGKIVSATTVSSSDRSQSGYSAVYLTNDVLKGFISDEDSGCGGPLWSFSKGS